MPKRISHLWAIAIAVTLSIAATAQSNPAPACPTLTVIGPPGIVQPGEIATYSANLDLKGSRFVPEFRWTTSVGDIVSGQGTSSIEVRQPRVGCITATVEVEGFPDSCPLVVSEASCGDPAPEAFKIGDVKSVETPDRTVLKLFASELKDNPNNQGFIFVGHPVGLSNEKMYARERRLVDLLKQEDLDSFDGSRATIVRHDNTADVAEFWRVPPGADNPLCRSCKLATGDLPATGDLVMADEFGKLSTSDELGRLDLIALDWQRNPSFYIFLYLSSDPKDSLGSKRTRLKRIKGHLTTKRKIPSDRVVILKGDLSYHSTQIYLVPADARHNMPTAVRLDSIYN